MNNAEHKFDYLVVLMMENRTFDTMLGYLYHPDNPAPFDRPPRGQSFDGVLRADGGDWTNPIPPEYQRQWGREHISLGRTTDFSSPAASDPYHDFTDVQCQLFGYEFFKNVNPCSPFAPPPCASMSGFAENYINSIVTQGDGEVTFEHVAEIMKCFSPCEMTDPATGAEYASVPVLSTLAVNYAVCDGWFSSLPGATMVNRSFLHSAQCSGWVNNGNDWTQNTSPTIFNQLMNADFGGMFDRQSSWRIYHDALDPAPLTFLLHPSIQPFEKQPFLAPSEQFFDDARRGTLPAYSFIEPRIVGADDDGRPHNDQHPVCDIRVGENLINHVYQAIASSPLRERILFVITYDEHGGLFDHVSPPAAVPPQVYEKPECGFRFDRLGVRVPAVLVSPYIEPGTVFRPTADVAGKRVAVPLDHTCVIKTLRNRWGIREPLTGRDDAAADLAQALTLDEPRADTPLMLPLWHVPKSTAARPLNDLQKDLLQMAADRISSKLGK